VESFTSITHIRVRWSGALAVGEKAALEALAVLFADDGDGPLPALDLRGVEFAEVEHLPLDGAPAMHAEAFAHRVVNMLFAVFVADTSFEEHARQRYSATAVVNIRGRPTRGSGKPGP
jgi:hypothetical protein